MLTFLLLGDRSEDPPPVGGSSLPATAWVVFLLHGAASTPLPCPRCGREATVGSNLDHLLRHHRAGYAEAADWLEEADADLFSLAVHYLASKARAGRDA